MRTHGDPITIIRHMVLLSAGAFAGCAVTDFGYVRIRSVLLFPVTSMLFSMILMR